MQLETERLILRMPRLDDVDAALEYISDPEVMRFISAQGAGDREVAQHVVERLLERWEANGFGQFAVERKDDGRFIGRVGLLVWDRRTWTMSTVPDAGENGEIELGWTLARASWGHGFATEAARAARAWAFEDVGVERLISIVNPANARSIRVVEKLGARPQETIEIDTGPAVVWVHPR
jgi:RimJ/RimL family protein N-acetyltransferase